MGLEHVLAQLILCQVNKIRSFLESKDLPRYDMLSEKASLGSLVTSSALE